MQRKVVVVTPVKNEDWILDLFLQSCSVWADCIVIADQASTDMSRSIVRRYKKAILVENPAAEFNENERQKLLLAEARKIPGEKVIFALDADEILSAGAWNTDDWRRLLAAPSGTVALFRWPLVESGFRRYRYGKRPNMPLAYVDDGAEHKGSDMHSLRIPMSDESPRMPINDFVVMHYQAVDYRRLQVKHVWYQLLERSRDPSKSPIQIFRLYNHMYLFSNSFYSPVPESWYEGYHQLGIDPTGVGVGGPYWWEGEIDRLSGLLSPQAMRHLDLPGNSNLLLAYLRATRRVGNWLAIRILDKILGFLIKVNESR